MSIKYFKGTQNMRFYQIAISFFVFTLTGLFYAQNALLYPMIYDDLHLIRSFTQEEIAHSFYGPFDTDNVETVGFRPLTMLFNYARYELLGENVVAHRLLLIILFAVFGVAIVAISFKLRTLSWEWATCAGVLCIGAKYNISHYVWLADGVHLIQGVLFGFSMLMFLSALNKHSFWLYAGSLSLTGLNLLVREDTLATIPAFFFLGGYFVETCKPQSKKGFGIYFLVLAVLCIAFMQYRALVLPQAQGALGNMFGFFDHIIYMLALPGLSHFNKISTAFVYLWGGAVIGLFALYLIEIRNSTSWKTAVWLVSGMSACLSGVSVARVNLLLFPIMFFTIFLCSLLESFAIRSRVKKFIALGILILGISSEFYITRITSQSFHPYSSTVIAWNGEFIYGVSSTRAIIPFERREKIVEQLQKVNIKSYSDLGVFYKRMVRKAISNNQRFPNGETLFVPNLEALIP
jgi:hypothetical protein